MSCSHCPPTKNRAFFEAVSFLLAGRVYGPDFGGRRIENAAGDGVLYDGQNAVQELSGATPVVNRLTGGIDESFARTDSAGTTFPLTDALSSTIAPTDSSGTVQTQYTYDPFGGVTATGSTSTNTHQFTGRVNDGTGLYYYRARYYSPRFMRFISEDPEGLLGGANSYGYALDSPITWIDPLGLYVTVTWVQSSGGNFFGHIVISVNGDTAEGFTTVSVSKWSEAEDVAGISLPGAVKRVDPSKAVWDSININTTPAQDAAVEKYIKNRTMNPGSYNLYGRNCADFAASALNAAGVHVPMPPLPPLTPHDLMDELHQLYDQPLPSSPLPNWAPIGGGLYYNQGIPPF